MRISSLSTVSIQPTPTRIVTVTRRETVQITLGKTHSLPLDPNQVTWTVLDVDDDDDPGF
jgi:hypothetical protein